MRNAGHCGSGRSGRRCGRNGLQHASTCPRKFRVRKSGPTTTQSHTHLTAYAHPETQLRMCILLLLLLNNITMARTAHLVTNLILSAVQYARYSCVTCGSSNIATSVDADHAMSSRTLAHIAKESTPLLEQTLTGCLSHRLRQGSVHLSIFCPVFLEEVLQRNQVDDN